jgi:adenylate cyclase
LHAFQERSLARDAENGTTMAAMLTALLALGEAERAREWARRAVLMDPDTLGMRYNLACDLIVTLGDVSTSRWRCSSPC